MSNLPPGVTDSMIPGNRPEDLLYERIGEALADLVADFGVRYSSRQDEPYGKLLDDLADFILTFRTEVDS